MPYGSKLRKLMNQVCPVHSLLRPDGTVPCYYCGIILTIKTVTRDHRVPRARGGTHTPINIVPACRPCNTAKKDMTEEEFRSVLIKLPTREK